MVFLGLINQQTQRFFMAPHCKLLCQIDDLGCPHFRSSMAASNCAQGSWIMIHHYLILVTIYGALNKNTPSGKRTYPCRSHINPISIPILSGFLPRVLLFFSMLSAPKIRPFPNSSRISQEMGPNPTCQAEAAIFCRCFSIVMLVYQRVYLYNINRSIYLSIYL